MVKKKSQMFMMVLLFLALMLLNLIMGIIGLNESDPVPISANVERGQICDVNVVYAAEIYAVKHSVNLIPTGKEHYYLAATDDDFIPLVIKANASWYKNNFDADGEAKGTVTVRCKVEGLDREFKSDFDKINNNISDYGAHVSVSLYLNSSYKRLAALRLVSGLLLLAAAIIGVVILATDRFATAAGSAVFIFGSIAAVFAVFVLFFGETI